ncbi:thermonuclease family protein [Peptoniphilus indolicus]|uniref:Thermonuclease n=2 Tax=Peptoniphilus indolicus TaxID=33030 RepID=G4D6R8_9FIRM|nr:thermonuclease family protein [Peptoniphilus indolicus]EGY76399.1 thermonuclease [Peptoniphilus indolicus ATCC 29427]SUB76341.1 Thermonuclease precursor [Peptoniphilus indolicus]
MRDNRYLSFIFLIILIIIYIYLQSSNELIVDNYNEIIVTKVVDGDTVITSDGEKIRIIGINAPEISKKEYLSLEAKDLAEKIMLNKKVFIEKDVETRDKYGRILGYIWLEIPNELNRDTIENLNYSGIALRYGLARVYTFKPNDKYQKIFNNIQKKAIKEKNGMWEYSIEGTTRGNALE